jgi:hypothetical protein
MPRRRVLGVGVVALVGLIGAVPAASAGGPPALTIEPIVYEVDCGWGSITSTGNGWLGLPADVENPTYYHLTWEYSNAEGKVWKYIDTGLVRTFERDGVQYVSLSGHSVNVGPGETGWYGRWVFNQLTDEVWRAGHGVGNVDQRACGMLAPSP